MQSHLATERQKIKASRLRNNIVLTDFDQQWKNNFSALIFPQFNQLFLRVFSTTKMYINKRNKIKLVDFIINLFQLLSNGSLCRNVN